MSKTTAVTIITVALMAIIGGLAWWYFSISKKTASTGEKSGETGLFENLFPFGNANAPSGSGNEETPGKETTSGEAGQAPLVREISSAPVAGFTITTDSLGAPVARYLEQETGHIYEAPLEVVSKKRLTNTTIPKVRDILWLPGGNSFLARYLGEDDVIETFSATINITSTSTEGEGTVGGKFLPRGIFDLSLVSPKDPKSKATPRIFYMTVSAGGSLGSISDASGAKAANIFSSKLKEWLSFPVNEQKIYLQTKPSGQALGYLFSLSTKTGELERVLGPSAGLSALPDKDGLRILYSEIRGGAPRLLLWDSKTKKVASVGLSTLADKCVWSESGGKIFCAVPAFFDSGTYPDFWYQGKVSFTDSLWQIDAATLQTKEVLNLPAESVFIDADKVAVSEGNTYLVIRNKENSSLWSIRLPK